MTEPADLTLLRVEERIERAERQLDRTKQVRSTALFGGIPFLGLMAAALVPVLDVSILDAAALLPSSVMAVVLGGTAALGYGAHRGVRRAEARLDELEAQRATQIGFAAGAVSLPTRPDGS